MSDLIWCTATQRCDGFWVVTRTGDDSCLEDPSIWDAATIQKLCVPVCPLCKIHELQNGHCLCQASRLDANWSLGGPFAPVTEDMVPP